MKNPFKKLKIMVVGEAGWDVYLEGESNRQSPEADVPVINNVTPRRVPGMSANVIENLHSLGAKAELFSVNYGKFSLYDRSRPRIEKVRILANGKHIVRIDTESNHPISKRLGKLYVNAIQERVHDYDAVILQDYGKGLWTKQTLKFIQYAAKKGKKVFVDPHHSKGYGVYAGAYLIKANLNEHKKMCMRDSYLEDYYGFTYHIVTLGERGMRAADSNGETISWAKTERVKAVDPTGAGDTALSILTCALLTGYSIKRAMEMANKGAGLVVQRMGVSTVKFKDVV